jgi:polygalacturonase
MSNISDLAGFQVFNVQEFDAVPDGISLNTNAFNDAIAACAESGGFRSRPFPTWISAHLN